MPWLEPLTLTAENAILEPLSHDHHDALCDAVRDGDLWNLWYTAISSPETMRAEIDRRLALQVQGSMVPFTVRTPDGKVAGMTTYMNIDRVNRRVEIGSTWYAKSAQRTSLNTACKLLLLRHAFVALNCIAVEFRTNFFNFPSREAILRLGAKQDGILRHHQVLPDGSLRDTVVFSIVAPEWPAVKKNLLWRMTRPRQR